MCVFLEAVLHCDRGDISICEDLAEFLLPVVKAEQCSVQSSFPEDSGLIPRGRVLRD